MSATKKNWSTKNIRLASVLFLFITIAFFFSFATSSHAITITGTETITTNSSASYSTADCNGTVSWNITGTGASINSNGVLTTGPASCGGITITASCSDGTIEKKEIRITNSGQWIKITECGTDSATYCHAGEVIGKYWYHTYYCYTSPSACQTATSCPIYTYVGCNCTPSTCWVKYSAIYEWQCPAVCTSGQTIPCYSGAGGTQGVGICKAGTQTCTNGQWGACQGEVTPVAEICGDGKDNNCDGQTDEGCCGYTIPNVPSLIPQCDTRWPNIKYDNTQKTICKKGCAMSSLTMLMNSMGCYTDLLTVNGCSECFVGAGSVDWEKILGAFCPSVSYIDSKTFSKDAPQPFKQFIDSVQLKQDMENGYRYILWVKSPTGSQCGHFVFLKGISEDCNKLEVIDPANTYTAITKICGYRKFK